MIYKCQKTKLFSLIPNLVMSLGLLANFERIERERERQSCRAAPATYTRKFVIELEL